MHILPVFTIRFFNYSYKLNLIQEIRFTHFFENVQKSRKKKRKFFIRSKEKFICSQSKIGLQNMQNRHPCKICKTDTLAKYAKQTPLQNMQNRCPCKICKTDALAKYAKQTPLQNMQNRHPCKICKTDTLAKYAKQTPL
jgi:hypothetical protein